MVATYRLRTDEITDTFLKSIQDNYQNKEIEITIQEVEPATEPSGRGSPLEDETDYLLKSEANEQHLLRGIAEIRSGKPLQTMTVEQLNQMV